MPKDMNHLDDKEKASSVKSNDLNLGFWVFNYHQKNLSKRLLKFIITKSTQKGKNYKND